MELSKQGIEAFLESRFSEEKKKRSAMHVKFTVTEKLKLVACLNLGLALN